MARPRTPKLSRPGIAAAALDLVDRTGEFTIPALAAALRVSPSSLYNHVCSKADIVELMRGTAMSAVAIPGSEDDGGARAPGKGPSWSDTLREIAIGYLDSYARHPRLIPLLTAYTVRDATTLRVYDAMARALAAGGFDPAARLRAVTILDSFILGSALDAAAPAVVWEADEAASDEFTQALAAGLDEPDRARRTFLEGLDLILDGWAARAETDRSTLGV
ncbi:TetR/AcrR family transcriptional regulator C-terminal domain-containing protein [Micrococcaceae bacterium RIT802]|nr:TetR/AcrR family transcriptional regulator C-terminal domain-containing protein [Micrococcaceae bacterium RIT 802]